jgi:hypothetical protein
MTPQKIATKLNKIEKVELSLKDDIIKFEKRASDTRSMALKSLNKVIEQYESAKHTHGIALDAAEKGLVQAKELGASNFIKYMQNSVDFNKGTIKILNKTINNLKTARTA